MSVSAGASVRIAEVTKTYRLDENNSLTAVDSVSMTIAAGSVTALVGPSGSGKSTLLHLIGGIDRPQAGTLVVGQQDLTELSRAELGAYRRRVGFVFQRFNLLPALTALDNVIAPVIPFRVSFDKVQRGRELLASVGLAEKERMVPSRLSGGQQQRVAIARALVNDPSLLLADEPTGNLDSRTGGEILELLLGLRENRGVTVVIATHDPNIAAQCDRLVRLQDGRVTDDIDVRGTTSSSDLLEQTMKGPE
jgi:putative ABC transport system ATP-binding protein